jgi:hypothetical protein
MGGCIMFKINALNVKGATIPISIDVEKIDCCPICHKGIEPIIFNNYLIGENIDILQRLYRCPRNQCGRIFLANYYRYSGGLYKLNNLEPRQHKELLLPNLLKENFPNFCEIYEQAMIADEMNLKEITGIGLRKSLEFLIKDFVIKNLKSDDADQKIINEVEKSFLGTCIEKYINDPTIKRRAKRAVWLGNDETHFFKKWPEKDLTDLKNLIEITISSIEAQLLDEKYQKEMEKPR